MIRFLSVYCVHATGSCNALDMGAEGASDILLPSGCAGRSKGRRDPGSTGLQWEGGSGGPKVKEGPGSTWIRLADQWGELEEGWPNRGAVMQSTRVCGQPAGAFPAGKWRLMVPKVGGGRWSGGVGARWAG